MLINILGFIWIASMLGNLGPISRTLNSENASADRFSTDTLIPSPLTHRYSQWARQILRRSGLEMTGVDRSQQRRSAVMAASSSVSTVSLSSSQLDLSELSQQTQTASSTAGLSQQARPIQSWLSNIGSLLWRPGLEETSVSHQSGIAIEVMWPLVAEQSITAPAPEQSLPPLTPATATTVLETKETQPQHQTLFDPGADVVVKRVQPNVKTLITPKTALQDLGNQSYLQQCLGMLPPEHLGQSHQGETAYQIWVKGLWVGEVSTLETAYEITQKLKTYLQTVEASADQIRPMRIDGQAAIVLNDQVLFVVPTAQVSEPAASASESNAAAANLWPIQESWVVIGWVNNLRIALGASPLDTGAMQVLLYGFDETGDRFSGTASWYGPYFHGRQTANGEIFNQHALTAAHPSLPLGTYLKVTNQLNGRTVIVRINDRGPYIGDRSLDLSLAAAQCLGSEHIGVIPYEAEFLIPNPENSAPDAFDSHTEALQASAAKVN